MVALVRRIGIALGLLGLLGLLRCAPASVPRRGLGLAPLSAGERRVEQWAELYLALRHRPPAERSQLLGRLAADLGPLEASELSWPFRADRTLLLEEAARDRARSGQARLLAEIAFAGSSTGALAAALLAAGQLAPPPPELEAEAQPFDPAVSRLRRALVDPATVEAIDVRTSTRPEARAALIARAQAELADPGQAPHPGRALRAFLVLSMMERQGLSAAELLRRNGPHPPCCAR